MSWVSNYQNITDAYLELCKTSLMELSSEAATGGVLLKKVFLEILQNTCARDPFLIKLQA